MEPTHTPRVIVAPQISVWRQFGLPLGTAGAVVFAGMIVAGVGRHNRAMVVGVARSA